MDYIIEVSCDDHHRRLWTGRRLTQWWRYMLNWLRCVDIESSQLADCVQQWLDGPSHGAPSMLKISCGGQTCFWQNLVGGVCGEQPRYTPVVLSCAGRRLVQTARRFPVRSCMRCCIYAMSETNKEPTIFAKGHPRLRMILSETSRVHVPPDGRRAADESSGPEAAADGRRMGHRDGSSLGVDGPRENRGPGRLAGRYQMAVLRWNRRPSPAASSSPEPARRRPRSRVR